MCLHILERNSSESIFLNLSQNTQNFYAGTRVNSRSTQLTLAHEIAHSLGARHDEQQQAESQDVRFILFFYSRVC